MNDQKKQQHFKNYVESLSDPKGWQIAYPILEQAAENAIDDVLDGISHPNWRVRKWCVAFMDHFADDRCLTALVEALDDPIADVRRHAVHSVGCQACKLKPLELDVIDLLIDRALNDVSIRVRRSAVHMIGNQIADDRAISALNQIIQTDQDAKLISNAKWSLKRHLKADQNYVKN